MALRVKRLPVHGVGYSPWGRLQSMGSATVHGVGYSPWGRKESDTTERLHSPLKVKTYPLPTPHRPAKQAKKKKKKIKQNLSCITDLLNFHFLWAKHSAHINRTKESFCLPITAFSSRMIFVASKVLLSKNSSSYTWISKFQNQKGQSTFKTIMLTY